ncbi:META domain-containing protein [Hymenobacter fastidiosus]|uniref:META domain-containing protein n=1 Tax=Hymenobacter fastidiosus TaxID=486264 RepID=UPI0031F07F0C
MPRILNNQLVATAGQEPCVRLRATGRRAEGHGGGSRFTDSFELPAEDQLRFGALLSTRTACADDRSNTIETTGLNTLTTTRTYQIKGDPGRLFAAAFTSPAAILHAVYLR